MKQCEKNINLTYGVCNIFVEGPFVNELTVGNNKKRGMIKKERKNFFSCEHPILLKLLVGSWWGSCLWRSDMSSCSSLMSV